MSWFDAWTEPQRQELAQWLDHTLHDLVKYLELMPRNLDWEALEEDDLELLYEAIFETRVDRSGSRSALDIWQAALEALPEPMRQDLPVRDQIDAHMATLKASEPVLTDGQIEDLDVEALKEALFGIGKALRSLRDGSG